MHISFSYLQIYPPSTLFSHPISFVTMKTSHPNKLHNHNQHSRKGTSLFSCAFFRQCTDSPLSPTPPHTSPPHLPPSLSLLPQPRLPASRLPLSTRPALPPPPLPPHNNPTKPSDSETSSSSTSQSFTQWRFPPTYHQPADPSPAQEPAPPQSELHELYHMAELHFTPGSDSDHLAALQIMERTLVPNPPSDALPDNGSVVVPTVVMSGVITYLKENIGVKPATKVLLALCLAESNRHVAVACGGAARVVDALPDLEGPVAERALAALDLMCTVPEGAAQVRAHALAVPMLVAVMGQMEGRGREYAISVLASVYGSGDNQLWAVAPAEEVARAVVLAMQQGDCSARGKRKGAHLLKVLKDKGKVDITQ